MSSDSRVNSQATTYRCSVCGREFQTKSGYIKHKLPHRTTFKCETSGNSIPNKIRCPDIKNLRIVKTTRNLSVLHVVSPFLRRES